MVSDFSGAANESRIINAPRPDARPRREDSGLLESPVMHRRRVTTRTYDPPPAWSYRAESSAVVLSPGGLFALFFRAGEDRGLISFYYGLPDAARRPDTFDECSFFGIFGAALESGGSTLWAGGAICHGDVDVMRYRCCLENENVSTVSLDVLGVRGDMGSRCFMLLTDRSC